MKRLILITVLFITSFSFANDNNTRKLSSLPVSHRIATTDYYYIWTGAANKKISFKKLGIGLKELYFDTSYAKLHKANIFTGLNTFAGGVVGNGDSLDVVNNPTIIALNKRLDETQNKLSICLYAIGGLFFLSFFLIIFCLIKTKRC